MKCHSDNRSWLYEDEFNVTLTMHNLHHELFFTDVHIAENFTDNSH